MQAFEIIGGILLILMAIAIIIMVLMQEGKGGGASALGGAPVSYTHLMTGCKSFPAPTGNSIWVFPPVLPCWIRSQRDLIKPT